MTTTGKGSLSGVGRGGSLPGVGRGGSLPGVGVPRAAAGVEALADEAEEELNRLSGELINRLFVLLKNGLLYSIDNSALRRPLEQVVLSLRSLAALREVTAGLGIQGDDLYLNRHIIKPDAGTYHNGRFLARVYQRLRAQELQLDVGLGIEELRAIIGAIRRVILESTSTESLQGIPGFTLVPLEAVEEEEEVEVDSRIQILRIFAGSIAIMTQVMNMAAAGRRYNPSILRRVAHDLIDAMTKEPNLLLALVHLPVPEGRLGAHLVRVALLSLATSSRARLPRACRMELALVSLYHHLGKPTRDGDAVAVDGDPVAASSALLCFPGLNVGLVRCVVGVYESTSAALGLDRLYLEGEADNLLGRTVFLADRYATLLDVMKPDEALRVLLHQHREAEPHLLRVLVSAIGLYPVGTIVELESGARAVVVEAPRHASHLLRPVVQILEGGEAGLVDLSHEACRHGRVVGSIDAAESSTNVSYFFLL
jgi:hypothetical protein